MKLRISNLFFGLIVLIHMLSGVAYAAKKLNPTLVVQQAEQCRDVSERLERLRCFDRVFDTPLMRIVTRTEQSQAPVMWLRAMDSAKQIAEGEMMHVTVQGTDEKHGNAWLVLQASNNSSRFEKGQKPILMMSCIDRISRIDLVLPQAIPDPRVKLSVKNATQYWRSDDTGLLLSSGRGIPAIRLMEKIASQKQTVLHSNSTVVDGLAFDTHQLKKALMPLKQRCGW